MELVVVLAVLAPWQEFSPHCFPTYFAALISDRRDQTAELSKAVQLYQASFISYPDNFDLLTDGSIFLLTFRQTTGHRRVRPVFVEAKTLTSDELGALNRVGIANVQKLANDATPAGFHPTMKPLRRTIVTDKINLGRSCRNDQVRRDRHDDQYDVPTRFLQTLRDADPTARYSFSE